MNTISQPDHFESRHLGEVDASPLFKAISSEIDNVDQLIDQVVPESIATKKLSGKVLAIADGISERDALAQLKGIVEKNQVYRSLIGQGYYGTYTPGVIKRNILENPAWYTAYTPYQPEISQGRLEALLNFQTAITDLTGMEVANASMLDEGTAAAEAMAMAKRNGKVKSSIFFVDQDCFPQTIAVLETRAKAAGLSLKIGDPLTDYKPEECFGVLLQYPGNGGAVVDYGDLIAGANAAKSVVVMAADILALLLLKSPGDLGADIAVGSSQRFGVPMGFGGPHAGYMATKKKMQRTLPGRLVGVSIDSHGNPAHRLALQTREQHIRREKATSNICTAQVLLAVMASMYAVYHGAAGLRAIATRVAKLTRSFADAAVEGGFKLLSTDVFDTVTVKFEDRQDLKVVIDKLSTVGINVRLNDDISLSLSFDELTDEQEVKQVLACFDIDVSSLQVDGHLIPEALLRGDEVLTHPVFSAHHSETEMLRYIRTLSDKDLALDRTMIPLGSCTMKLNATSEMEPITWPELSNIHPFAPAHQVQGYIEMIAELEELLAECTGYDAVSIQPNAGSQGEFAGLLAISAYHASRGDTQRNICLIPQSAHGTNPASAQMCSMKVVVVACDDQGNIDIEDLRAKATDYAENLAAIMVTYPSTHGVFESHIREVTEIIHENGGQVYVDGANLNAMVGLCEPGEFGGDVSHLNLHKTFCIPHGGGGPGVGPVAAKAHLAPFLPTMASKRWQNSPTAPVISAAPFGSASILPISWMYIKMMGGSGLKRATELAIINANYIAARLKDAFPVLYTGENGYVAHECIIDLRPLKDQTGISVEDVAKRLIDYGFHAPTMSFPVAGTLMIEPTESESKAELDRFCDAMLQIRSEISRVESGEWPLEDNPLVNAPHTAISLMTDEWVHAYSREEAAYPLASLRQNKYFSPVGRVDNVHGDRNLVCSCPPLENYLD